MNPVKSGQTVGKTFITTDPTTGLPANPVSTSAALLINGVVTATSVNITNIGLGVQYASCVLPALTPNDVVEIFVSVNFVAGGYPNIVWTGYATRYSLDDIGAKTVLIGTGGSALVTGTTPQVVVGGGKSGSVVSKATKGSTTNLLIYAQRSDGSFDTPSEVVYRIDDAKSSTAIVADTPLTPGNPTALVITPEQNVMSDANAKTEDHVITITVTFSDGSRSTGEFIHQLENLRFL